MKAHRVLDVHLVTRTSLCFAIAMLSQAFERFTFVPTAARAAEMEQPKTIGSAKMLDDGTIVLDLRAAGPGMLGEARVSYPPSHPQYQNVLRHLGGLRPGEEKHVPPWKNVQ